MSLPIYSSVLIASKDLLGEVALEVPDGLVCVVRDMDAVQKGPGIGATVWSYDTDGVQFWAETLPSFIDLLYWTSWRGRQVIPGPGFFYMSTTVEMDVRASGYLLTRP
jgi:hypothetical protein